MRNTLALRVGLVLAAAVVAIVAYVTWQTWPFITAKPYSVVGNVMINRCCLNALAERSAPAAGVSQTLCTIEDIAERIEVRNAKPAKRGPYMKHVT